MNKLGCLKIFTFYLVVNWKFGMTVTCKTIPLDLSKHIAFICGYFEESNDPMRIVEKISMSHISMNVLYWATGTLAMIAREKLSALELEIYSYITSCWKPEIGIIAWT